MGKKHNLKVGTVSDLIKFRLKKTKIVKLISERPFESEMGSGFSLKIFQNTISGEKHYALVKNIKKNNNPYLIEYNVRMGDPECQTILPKLKTDLLDIFLACCNERLNEISIEWSNQKSLCIVLCSKGYPGTYKNNVLIKDFNKLKTKKNQKK